MERTLIDACRRLTSTTALELAPDLADIDMTPLSQYGDEKNGNNTIGSAPPNTTSALVEHIRKGRKGHTRSSITHSYQDISPPEGDSDGPDSRLHKRMDHLSRFVLVKKFLIFIKYFSCFDTNIQKNGGY